MNKLYVIRFKLSNGYTVSTWYGWNEPEAIDKMAKNPEWKFDLVADNETHKIWDAR